MNVYKNVPFLSYIYVINFDILVSKFAGNDLKHGRFNLMRWELIGDGASSGTKLLITYAVDLVFKDYLLVRNPDLSVALTGKMYLQVEGIGNAVPKTTQTMSANIVTQKTGSTTEFLFIDNALYSTQKTEELDLVHLISDQPFIFKVIYQVLTARSK